MQDAEIIETHSKPSRAVIWMHGLGADGTDFVPIVPQLSLPSHADIRFIFPNAPMAPVTINGGYVMRSWYDIKSLDQSEAERANADDIARSVQRISAIIDQQIEAGIPADKIVLAGFSQGGVIALHTALHYPQTVSGVMALSTYFPNADSALAAHNKSNFPIFSGHGTEDDVVPHVLAARYRETFKEQGFEMTVRDYPIPHSVSMEEIHDIGLWLAFNLFR